MKNVLISSTLANLKNHPRFTTIDATGYDEDQIIDASGNFQFVILNGHAGGMLNFCTGPSVSLQGSLLPRLAANGVAKIMLLTCHVGQLRKVNLPALPARFYIGTDYALSFATYNLIMATLMKNPDDWAFVSSLLCMDGTTYNNMKLARQRKLRGMSTQPGDDQLLTTYDEAFVDVTE